MINIKASTYSACSLVVLISMAAIAQNSVGDRSAKLTNREKLVRYSGGFLIVKDNAEGCITLINSQTAVSLAKIKTVAEKFEERSRVSFSYLDGVTLHDLKSVKSVLAKSKGTISVLIADIEGLPVIINLPEERCCLVNVAPLKLESEGEKLNHRVRVEVARAICFALQLPYSEAPGGVYDPITSLKELDGIMVEHPGVEVFANLSAALKPFKIVPYRRVGYRKACEEGWAPAPTNELQKAVWDQVHSTPSKPLKIEFDPATQKGKVTK